MAVSVQSARGQLLAQRRRARPRPATTTERAVEKARLVVGGGAGEGVLLDLELQTGAIEGLQGRLEPRSRATPGFRRPNTLSQRERRSTRPLAMKVRSWAIVIGRKTSVADPEIGAVEALARDADDGEEGGR